MGDRSIETAKKSGEIRRWPPEFSYNTAGLTGETTAAVAPGTQQYQVCNSRTLALLFSYQLPLPASHRLPNYTRRRRWGQRPTITLSPPHPQAKSVLEEYADTLVPRNAIPGMKRRTESTADLVLRFSAGCLACFRCMLCAEHRARMTRGPRRR